ncbi:hypothetical protein ONZ43_g5743 [Nemania bipapillata]|uniref:Uncharacterized protein n=1 Tax=Nemania bipapillata TaxID=110536 RepID=A0ACC2I6Y0_9PEZI|nr:hypothetical protein ONZ43_g5743 [Nemania bipapillata]
MAACGIIACNCWDGSAYIAEKNPNAGGKEGHTWHTLYRPYDNVLTAGFNYYFIVDKPDNCYPVVAGFDHWRFPHGSLPSLWQVIARRRMDNTDLAEAVTDNVGSKTTCDSTGEVGCVETIGLARVAPFSNKTWFESNQMEKYNRLQSTMRRNTNVQILHCELGEFFGESWLSSTGLDDLGQISKRLEIHPSIILQRILSESDSQRNGDQDGKLQAPIIQCEHLFARFAFNILSNKNYKFLRGNEEYTVCFFDFEKGEQYTTNLHSDAIVERRKRISPMASRIRNTSLNNTKTLPNGQTTETSWGDDSSSDSGDSSKNPYEYEGVIRGRARRRSDRYYQLRALRDGDQQHRDNVQLENPTPDTQRMGNKGSISTISLTSSVTMSSFGMSYATPTSGMKVDHEKKAAPAANRVNPKRPRDEDEDQDETQPPKRPRQT